ncbi:MAG: ExeA family protein [Thermodesulfobacteriota bacterium]
MYFVKAKKSFALVCGDVGTGKTMLINYFLSRLPGSIEPVIISNPFVNSQDLLIYLARKLNIKSGGNGGVLDLMDKVKDALIAAIDQHRQLILIVDEAHLLSDQALEEIRLLSNLETPEQKLLQILLVGQYELSYKLDRPEMRHLRQRINVNRFLSHMNSQETILYIDHRLKQVRSSFASVFEPKCQDLIFRLTGGVPRRVNQICDNALLIAMAEGASKVTPKILKKAEEAAQTDLIFTPKSTKAGVGYFKRFFGLRSAITSILAILVLGITALLGIIALNGGFLGKKGTHVSYQNSELIQTSPVTQAHPLELPKGRSEHTDSQ